MAELSPRAQSAHILRTGAGHGLPTVESLAVGYDAVAELEAVKPLHYAKLAETIDVLLDTMLVQRTNRLPDGFVQSEYCSASDNPWVKLRANTLATTHEAIKEIEATACYRETEAINIFIGRLDPNRFIHTGMQLLAGADTAASSMLTVLRNIPGIAKFHGFDDDPASLERLARNSHGLVFRQAMICVDRMMAAQAVLSEHEQHESWARIDEMLNPEHFKLIATECGPVLRYVNFPGLVVPAGYKRGPNHEPIEADTRLGELQCYQEVTIGCPITLLKGRMQELWNWYIDVIVETRMWGN
jgi:hypothetical protein